MSPRRRKAEDADVFGALVRVMLRRSPAELTLREIAAEAGVTAGALVQRFGSKRAMMLAHARYAAATGDIGVTAPPPRTASPLEALRAVTAVYAQLADSPPPELVRARVDQAKNEGQFPLDVAEHAADGRERTLAQVYQLYQDRLAAMNALDFGDLLLQTYRLLRDNPDTLARWQRRAAGMPRTSRRHGWDSHPILSPGGWHTGR